MDFDVVGVVRYPSLQLYTCTFAIGVVECKLQLLVKIRAESQINRSQGSRAGSHVEISSRS